MEKVYIFLPVHNRRDITESFVKCLQRQTFTHYQLVLIDDGSRDGTADMVVKSIPSAVVLRGDGSLWWAGSLQKGLDWLKHQDIDPDDLVLFINDDVTFLPNYLENAVRLMAGKNKVMMLSRLAIDGEVKESGVSINWRKLVFSNVDAANEIDCLSTRGLFIHWDDVRAIGGFHPFFLPHYLSDYEYSIRGVRRGLECQTSAELWIIPQMDQTGYHLIKSNSFGSFLKKFFSKKSPSNPLYWTVFIFLAAPPRLILRNLAYVWWRAVRQIAQAFFSSKFPCSHR